MSSSFEEKKRALLKQVEECGEIVVLHQCVIVVSVQTNASRWQYFVLITTQKHVLRAELRNVVARFEPTHTLSQASTHSHILSCQFTFGQVVLSSHIYVPKGTLLFSWAHFYLYVFMPLVETVDLIRARTFT